MLIHMCVYTYMYMYIRITSIICICFMHVDAGAHLTGDVYCYRSSADYVY